MKHITKEKLGGKNSLRRRPFFYNVALTQNQWYVDRQKMNCSYSSYLEDDGETRENNISEYHLSSFLIHAIFPGQKPTPLFGWFYTEATRKENKHLILQLNLKISKEIYHEWDQKFKSPDFLAPPCMVPFPSFLLQFRPLIRSKYLLTM